MSSVLRPAWKGKTLFVQHAGALGGSTYSLLYTMQGLREKGYAAEVALTRPSELLIGLYSAAGFPVHVAPEINILAHTTGGYARLDSPSSWRQLGRQLARWSRSRAATLDLLDRVRPDIVHLNSVVLLPSAQALRRAEIPHVWHVRESPPCRGWRTNYIRRELLRHQNVIFLSQFDRQHWTGARGHGIVVPNFVSFSQFDANVEKTEARRQLGFDSDLPLVLYVGGTTEIKGFSVLLEAIPAVRKEFPGVVFAMPGAAIYPTNSRTARIARTVLPLIGWGTAGQRVVKRIERLGIGDTVRMLPFANDIVPWLAACDLLVFPSTAPHFARPVIEAAAMRRPAVGSDIGGVNELIERERTGLLVPPGRPKQLSAAILRLLAEPKFAQSLGLAAHARARLYYSQETGIAALDKLYQTLAKVCMS